MLHRGHRARLTQEPLDGTVGRGGRLRDQLDRDPAAERRVLCEVDLSHPARAEQSHDLVAGDRNGLIEDRSGTCAAIRTQTESGRNGVRAVGALPRYGTFAVLRGICFRVLEHGCGLHDTCTRLQQGCPVVGEQGFDLGTQIRIVGAGVIQERFALFEGKPAGPEEQIRNALVMIRAHRSSRRVELSSRASQALATRQSPLTVPGETSSIRTTSSTERLPK